MSEIVAAQTFSLGDWVFCEYELRQITGMHDGRVTDTSTSLFSHGGYDLSDRCFNLSLPLKRISDDYAWWSAKIHSDGAHGLNYPDIHRWLVDHWAATCRADAEQRPTRMEELHRFAEHVITAGKGDSGYGFPLMRPR